MTATVSTIRQARPLPIDIEEAAVRGIPFATASDFTLAWAASQHEVAERTAMIGYRRRRPGSTGWITVALASFRLHTRTCPACPTCKTARAEMPDVLIYGRAS